MRRMGLRFLFLGLLGLTVGPAPAGAQDSIAPLTLSPDAPQSSSKGDDVTVTAPSLATESSPTKVEPDVQLGFGIRTLNETSTQFARCVRNPQPELVSEIIDGMPNSAKQAYALGRFILQHRTCYPGMPYTYLPTEKELGECHRREANGVFDCQAQFDRAAILDRVIGQYAPDLTLSRKDTLNRAVQERFNLLEGPRNRYRLPRDQKFFEIAVCMVRMQPEMAIRLYRAEPGSKLAAVVGRNMIARTRPCVGYARKVVVDPIYLRMYVVDALYRWTVAARNVPSLLPAMHIASAN